MPMKFQIIINLYTEHVKCRGKKSFIILFMAFKKNANLILWRIKCANCNKAMWHAMSRAKKKYFERTVIILFIITTKNGNKNNNKKNSILLILYALKLILSG